MGTKELLTVEFGYFDVPRYDQDSGHNTKIITIGIYDTFEEAAKAGNEVLKILRPYFGGGDDPLLDRFVFHGLLGFPTRGVGNYGRAGGSVRLVGYRVEMTKLDFADLRGTIAEMIESTNRYKEYKKKEEEEECDE